MENKDFEIDDILCPECKETYYSNNRSDGLDIHSINSFIDDTYAEATQEDIKEAMGRIELETEHIKMGTTNEKALSECTVFLKDKGIETGDLSKALDISALRVLKMMPGIHDLKFVPEGENHPIKCNILLDLICTYIISEEEQFLRYTVTGSEGETTLDQHMRIYGAPVNIQRHITKKEMGIVLAYVRDIVRGYIQQR